MTIVPGYLGSYPNFFFEVSAGDIPSFVARLSAATTNAEFTTVVDTYGIRRSSPRFWQSADWFHEELTRRAPVEAGRLDLSRYDDL